MQTVINPQDFLILAVLALINIVISVLFCKSLIKALSFIRPENQAIKAGKIWLLLIPVFNYFMNFIVVKQLSKSISSELESRDFEEEKRPALVLGITFAVLSLLMALSLFVPIPPKFQDVITVLGFAQLFFFFQYWMKINWYKKVLENDEAESVSS